MGWLRDLFRRPPRLHVAIDRGSGPTVVLLHGIASSSVTYENLVPLLDDRRRVVAIDLLGFGESPPGVYYTVEEHVRALRRTIRSARIRGRFVLVGHSMGGIIAARFAAERPRSVARLVLVSPPVYFSPDEIGTPSDRAGMDLYYRAYEFLRGNKEFTIRAAAQLARLSPIRHLLDISEHNWAAFALSLENSIERQTTVSDLARVRARVEVVYGALDPFIPQAGLRIIERLRGVTVHRVAGADHVIRPRMARVIAIAIEGGAPDPPVDPVGSSGVESAPAE